MLAFKELPEIHAQRKRASLLGVLDACSYARRSCSVVLLLCAASLSATAQIRISFEGLDRDANGQLSQAEFGNLPGFYASPELFADLDKSQDRLVSRDEWLAGSPDESGVPLGRFAAARQGMLAGAKAGTPPALIRHGPNLPPEPVVDKRYKPLSDAAYRQLLTGRGGADGPKRPVPPPKIPPSPSLIPPDVLPPR
jgi:hypothetical protein